MFIDFIVGLIIWLVLSKTHPNVGNDYIIFMPNWGENNHHEHHNGGDSNAGSSSNHQW